MGSLFVKLFLWLWLTMIIIAGAFVITWHHWVPVSTLPSQSELEGVAAELRNLYSGEGDWRVVHCFLRSLSRRRETGLHFVILGEDAYFGGAKGPRMARGMPGRRSSEGLSPDALQSSLLNAERDSGRIDGMLYKRVPLKLNPQLELYLAAVYPAEGFGALPVWLRTLIALAVSGGLASALAAHLSRPLRRVRGASRALANGDLQTRVPVARHGNDEMIALGRDFNAMAERIQSLVEAQNQLLRDISHELRSPLARLQVALELARREAGKDSHALDRMEKDIERMDQLIGQLLTLARLESGAGTVQQQLMNLNSLIGQVCEDAQFESQDSGCRVEVKDGPNVQVFGDKGLLRSALENVIPNALRYTPSGGATQVIWATEQGGVAVRVRDGGPGVPAERLGDLFKPFVRLSSAREHEQGNYGLGLAITRRAVQVHGGSVSARNHPDGGLEIRLWLPVEES